MAAKLVKIGDAWLPGISAYRIDLEDIDSADTARSETGKMQRSVLRKKVKKLSLTLAVTRDELAEIAKLVAEDTAEMQVYCPADPDAKDGFVTSEFYVSKISADMITLSGKNYWRLNFNAVEV